ncbi:uncharacterized protein [Misgurnus anguillicaudatus]|uniref:uncharacterized protein n=1 Tax=Misgurnus anguillicaudatus TaxID=75329 RepID=UPI003CCF13EF
MDFSSSSSSEDELVLLLIAKRKRRRYWVHPILQQREEQGELQRLIQELKLYHDRFHRYFRMSVGQFESLLTLVAPLLIKSRTNYRKPIDPEQRLAVCLRFLGTGDSYRTIASSFHLGISTVAGIVAQTCKAIWDCLRDEHMPVPTEDKWRSTANRFYERWNFPNCLGAMNGKHIVIQVPANSGSQSLNGTLSVVLLALVDADYRFLAVDVDSYGSSCDGGVFSNSALGKALEDGSLNIPAPVELPSAPELGKVNYVIVADEAFPLKPYLLRPYPGRGLTQEDMRIFNHRLARARRVSENCFSILTQRFSVFHRRLTTTPTIVGSVVKAACVLYNYLGPSEQNSADQLLEEVSSDFRDIIVPLQRSRQGNHASREARNLRDTYKMYFNSPAGQVDWQYEHVHNGLGGT